MADKRGIKMGGKGEKICKAVSTGGPLWVSGGK